MYYIDIDLMVCSSGITDICNEITPCNYICLYKHTYEFAIDVYRTIHNKFVVYMSTYSIYYSDARHPMNAFGNSGNVASG